MQGYTLANCEVAARTAERRGLGAGVRAGLTDIYEQWDGRGGPRGLAGEAIPQVARIAQVAANRGAVPSRRGRRSRRGGGPPPGGHGAGPGAGRGSRAPGRAHPRRARRHGRARSGRGGRAGARGRVGEDRLDGICRAFGEALDLKTPWHHGHATGVAVLAAAAAQRAGLDAAAVAGLRRAALLHDLGRAGVPNGVCERAGDLTWGDRERVRLHAYHSERVLARCGPLAPLATLAGMHHQRLDGSGYHRQAAAGAIPAAARVLAAADVFQPVTQDRAHRPARSRDEAAAVLAAEARARRLDAEAARSVLEAAGASAASIPARARAAHRAPGGGASARRAGLSNRRIAERLVISPRTAEHHVQDVYARIGVSSRAAAALFAMEHDLL